MISRKFTAKTLVDWCLGREQAFSGSNRYSAHKKPFDGGWYCDPSGEVVVQEIDKGVQSFEDLSYDFLEKVSENNLISGASEDLTQVQTLCRHYSMVYEAVDYLCTHYFDNPDLAQRFLDDFAEVDRLMQACIDQAGADDVSAGMLSDTREQVTKKHAELKVRLRVHAGGGAPMVVRDGGDTQPPDDISL